MLGDGFVVAECNPSRAMIDRMCSERMCSRRMCSEKRNFFRNPNLDRL